MILLSFLFRTTRSLDPIWIPFQVYDNGVYFSVPAFSLFIDDCCQFLGVFTKIIFLYWDVGRKFFVFRKNGFLQLQLLISLFVKCLSCFQLFSKSQLVYALNVFFCFFFFQKKHNVRQKECHIDCSGVRVVLWVVSYTWGNSKLLYILKVASFYDFWRNQIYASLSSLYTDVYHDRLHSTWWLQTFNKGCSSIRTIQSENMKTTFKPIINHKQQTTSAVSKENSHQSKVFSPKMKLSILPMT